MLRIFNTIDKSGVGSRLRVVSNPLASRIDTSAAAETAGSLHATLSQRGYNYILGLYMTCLRYQQNIMDIMQGYARMDEAILALIVKAETETNVNLAVSELMRGTEFIFVAHSGAKPVTYGQ